MRDCHRDVGGEPCGRDLPCPRHGDGVRLAVGISDTLAPELAALVGHYGEDIEAVATYILRAWLHEHGEAAAQRVARRNAPTVTAPATWRPKESRTA